LKTNLTPTHHIQNGRCQAHRVSIPRCKIRLNSCQSRSLRRLRNIASHLSRVRTYSSQPCVTRKTYTLNTGAKIPALGLGTWQSQPHEVEKAVEIALRKGYRHIDTALAYGNEAEVGLGIKNSGVPREEFFLTTKLDNPWHKRVTEGLESSLKSLGTDYLDLYLMHWPCSTTPDDLMKHYPGKCRIYALEVQFLTQIRLGFHQDMGGDAKVAKG